MIHELPNLSILPLARISPSQLTKLRTCAGQVLLAQTYRGFRLLPPSPAALFGQAIHKLLELVTNQVYKNRQEIEEGLNHQLMLVEEKLRADGFAYLIPLRSQVRNSAVKFIQVIDRAETMLSRGRSVNQTTYRTEQWLTDTDKYVGGIVDAIIQMGEHVQLIDYKSGNIFDDLETEQLKTAYEEQLRLYAYLYFETHGYYPNQLTIIDLAGRAIDVSFSPDECRLLYEQAIVELRRVNQSLYSTPASLMTASPANCRWCEVRAACNQYIPEVSQVGYTTNIVGTLSSVGNRPNGLTLAINTRFSPITVISIPFTSELHWQSAIGQSVRLFGVKRIAESRYEWRAETMCWYRGIDNS